MKKNRYFELIASMGKNLKLTEEAWSEIRGTGSDVIPKKKLRRYLAGLRLCDWLKREISKIS